MNGILRLEECLDRNLVGGIEGDGVGSACFGCFEGQAKAGKAGKIRLFEVEAG